MLRRGGRQEHHHTVDSSGGDDESKSRRGRLRLPCKWFLVLLLVGGTAVGHLLRFELMDLRDAVSFYGRDLWDGVSQVSLPDHPVVFYNVFVPSTRRGKHNAMRIVEEQLAQLPRGCTIQYNTIGHWNTILQHRLERRACRYSKCHHIQHYNDAMEEVTLQRVYDYCESSESSRVIYLHNKGSFHTYKANERWRRHLTAAALACVQSPHACNLCGLQYVPVWASFIAGNMWMADCGYVRSLVPPMEFEGRLTSAVASMCQNLSMSLFSPQDGDPRMFLGVSRWSSELWIGSGPDVRPCDTSRQIELEYWQKRDNGEYDIQAAPRFDVNASWLFMQPRDRVWRNRDLRLREFVFLAGNIHKWQVLYNRVPSQDSWVWQWYPDSDFWRQAILQHPDNTVESVLQSSAVQKETVVYEACLDLRRPISG